MEPETLFKIINSLALPFWLLMIFAPWWSLTRRLMKSLFAPGLFAVLYAVLVVPKIPEMLPLFTKPDISLADIIRELSRPEAMVVAWLHFLAFDLFVGRWQYLDAQERKVSHWLLAPCLFFTLMFGPFGLVLYMGARSWGSAATKPTNDPPAEAKAKWNSEASDRVSGEKEKFIIS
jgi:hypothetical protein